MPRTVTDDEYKKTIGFVEEVLKPQIEKLLSIVNKQLARRGVRVGVELTWFVDGLTPEEVEEVKDDK